MGDRYLSLCLMTAFMVLAGWPPASGEESAQTSATGVCVDCLSSGSLQNRDPVERLLTLSGQSKELSPEMIQKINSSSEASQSNSKGLIETETGVGDWSYSGCGYCWKTLEHCKRGCMFCKTHFFDCG